MDIDTSLLPPVAKRLVAHLGLDHALAVIRAYGGLPLYVPKSPAPPQEFVAALGAETAAALCREFAGCSLGHIPKCLPALFAARNRDIVAAVAAGTPQTLLARQHGISWRQVHNIKMGRRNGRDDAPDAPAPEHPDLFSEPPT